MAEFKLERFKYNWRGDWAAGTEYKRDDVIRLGGKSYVCLVKHTASSIFASDLNAVVPGSSPPQPDPRWILMTSGQTFLGGWVTQYAYNTGDIVLLQGTLWLCVTEHVSTDFASDTSNWQTFAAGTEFLNNWLNNTPYSPGALVKYNGRIFKCVNAHLSGATLELNSADWQIFLDGIEYKGSWLPSTEYRVNDLVKYGGSIFRCTETHISGTLEIDDLRFTLEFPGNQPSGIWTTSGVYNQGDIVRHGGFLYYATENNTNSIPTNPDSTNPWIILYKSFNFVGQWTRNSNYQPGDLVQRGGNVYMAVTDVDGTQFDGSSLDYLDTDLWELKIPGKVYSRTWKVNTLYSPGEIVYYKGSAWVCNIEHESGPLSYPGDNGNGYFFFDLLIQGGQPAGMQEAGDLLTYGLSREEVGDGSTLGDIRIPVGRPGQVLSVSEDLEAFWRNFLNDSDVIFVSQKGTDADGFGVSFNRPFASVRYACEYIEDNFPAGSPVKLAVAAGRYKEVGPITIPAGTAVVGDELRATVIEASPAKELYQGDDWTYIQRGNTHLQSFILNTITNVPVTPTSGNDVPQVFTGPVSDLAATSSLVALITDFENDVEFRAFNGEIPVTLVGTNTPTTQSNLIAASIQLKLNKNFIVKELFAHLVESYPDVTFDWDKFRTDFESMIRAYAYDLRYPGNYKTLLASRRYANSVTGSQLDDIFYVRDTTGLRNCTIEGLKGVLNPPGVFDLYQRPTGGACVSLDPGWGPDDSRTWIMKRSPYIQGVTNIGSGCVGKKVDGALHNGGNRSMTSNDFTQVLSDGIGAWIRNNGRAELVSVFTYYCQVGYLADSGGIIRATNGNNSYGSWGSIADGNDPTETPDTTTLWNYNNEAQVESVFTGAQDSISVFEYTNCGVHYTNATAEIVGAGGNVNVAYTPDDIRQGALSQARLINTRGSGSEGGSGFTVRQGFAQITVDSASSLLLSGNDVTQDISEIEGMRILIIAGDGVGQYGYIDGFDPVTKTVTVRKDSTGELGWDHIIPGTPIQASLDSTAQYRIEPRLVANHPGFSATSYNLQLDKQFADVTIGGTTKTYIQLEVATGTGTTFENVAVAAQFRVVRAGTTYTVEVTNTGAGYAVGDELLILGSRVGGADSVNDITITVTEVSDDSTNEIIDFTFTGTPRGQRYVASSNPNFIQYSDDGQNWTQTTSSFVTNGEFKKLVAGNNRFINVAFGDNKLDFSYDAETWITRALPSTANWIDGVYGGDKFVIIAEDNSIASYSTDGLTWTEVAIPDDGVGDSTNNQWQAITYGKGKFLAVSGSNRAVAYSTNGITWTSVANALPNLGYDFVSVAYGNNRFLALSNDGKTTYSLDGITWYEGTDAASPDGSTAMNWQDMKYGNGVFLAICNTGGATIGNDANPATETTFCSTTEDGLLWYSRELANARNWSALTYAIDGTIGKFVILADNVQTGGMNHVVTGAQAKLRADVFQGSFQSVKIWDPGSGYDSVQTPIEIEVYDTTFTVALETDNKIGSGVLSQPSFISRGNGFRTSSTTVTIDGDGYADIIPEEATITLAGVDVVPGPGVQIRIDGVENPIAIVPGELRLFTGVKVEDLGPDNSGTGTRLVRFTITPRVRNEYNLEHGTSVELRSKYSQCRISGHDFLDIGTGNFEETNYPDIYARGNYFVAAPENEVLEQDGGRVFYVSTDQDGNFRAGELFAVEQATGIVTISAEFFELDGLSELALGGVRLGGSGAVVREFSTDPTFADDSNNIVPTQRAIATFLANRLSVGGENLEVNSIVAGRVQIGTQDDIIRSVSGEYVNFPRETVFLGTDENGNATAIQGSYIAQMMYFREDNDTVQ